MDRAAGGLRYAILNTIFHKSFVVNMHRGPIKKHSDLEKHMHSSLHG